MNWLFEHFRLLPKRLLLILIVMLAVMVIGGFLLVHAIFPSKEVIPPAPIATVEITANGFIPSTLKVQVGTKVIWVNYDQAPHQIAADPYPTHSDLPALIAPKALGYKQTYSFIFTKARTIYYYDEINPTWQGSIVVDP